MASLLAAGALVAGCDRPAKPDAKPSPAASAPAPVARDPLAAVAAQKEACLNGPEMREMRDCGDEAVEALQPLTAKSAGNAQLRDLYGAMFDPIMSALTEDDAPIAFQNVIVGAYSEFALARAAILTGSPQPPALARPVADAFARLGDGKAFTRRWTAIRDADCAAYPVADCAARLDAAMAAMLDDLDPKNDAEDVE